MFSFDLGNMIYDKSIHEAAYVDYLAQNGKKMVQHFYEFNYAWHEGNMKYKMFLKFMEGNEEGKTMSKSDLSELYIDEYLSELKQYIKWRGGALGYVFKNLAKMKQNAHGKTSETS